MATIQNVIGNHSTSPFHISTTESPVPVGPSGPHIDLQAVVIVFTTLQSIVMVLAVPGNLLVVIAFLRYLDMKKPTNKFIINLAVADLLTGIDMIFQITSFFVTDIGSHLVPCLFQFQTISAVVLSSQLSVIFCTIDRFVAICYPFKHNNVMTTRNTAIMLSIPWIYGVTVGLLPFLGLNNWVHGMPCIYGLVVSRAQLLIAAITTWIQTSACVVMYAMVLKLAWSRKKQIRPQNGTQVKRRDVKSGVTMGIVTVAFTVCWLPFSVTTFMLSLKFDPTVAFVGNCLVFIGVAHSIVNPFIYAWQKSEFRRACSRLLCRQSSARQTAQPSIGTISRRIERSDGPVSVHREGN